MKDNDNDDDDDDDNDDDDNDDDDTNQAKCLNVIFLYKGPQFGAEVSGRRERTKCTTMQMKTVMTLMMMMRLMNDAYLCKCTYENGFQIDEEGRGHSELNQSLLQIKC